MNLNSATDSLNQSYFNSQDMDIFYQRVSGEHTHCGLFQHPDEDINLAKQRTTEYMASLLPINKSSHLLDLGSGYGGAARYIARKYDCQISCLNLSEQQNTVNNNRNQEEKLSDLISVHQGTFAELPFTDNQYDAVIAQDSLFYSDTQLQAFREAHRVLKEGGDFLACTYFFSGDRLSEEETNRVAEWYTGGGIHQVYFLHIDDYRNVAQEIGMEEVKIIELTKNVAINYAQLLKKMAYLQVKENLFSEEFFSKKRQRLLDCKQMGESGLIQWGILQYKKLI